MMLFLPLASARQQVQVYGPLYGVPDGTTIGSLVFTDYYHGDNVTVWTNQTSYSVTLSTHEYYTVYTEYSYGNGTGGDCITNLGKYQNGGPYNTPLFLFCYPG